ncbi:MAG TPA: aminotransferase class IV [Gemmatimonadota bacterium]|nr:aminotransferase class IV [Gemmatimonadota bacterium]
MEIYADGHFLPLDAPVLAAGDRGFLQGEAVYESLKVQSRRALFLEAHLERLSGSAAALGIPDLWDAAEARHAIGALLSRAGLSDATARLYLTAGPPGGAPVRIARVEPPPPWAEPGQPPWRIVTHPERVVPYLPRVKHVSRLAHARARRAAREQGADDALLVHADGWALEGTASNVFFFEADTLHTPGLDCGVLAGITRDAILDLAPRCGFFVVEGRYPPEVVAASDECFLSFTSAGVRPVASLDGTDFPGGAPGPRTARLSEAYAARMAEALAAAEPLS